MSTNIYAQVLGYIYPNYFVVDNQDIIARCDAIVAELQGLDVKIAQAQDRIMATTVGDLSLDYGTQIHYWRSYATKLLEELSFRSGIPLVFNKYDTGSSSMTFSGGSVF